MTRKESEFKEKSSFRYLYKLPKGNLKGAWNHIVMDPDDSKVLIDLMKKPQRIVLIILFFIPFLFLFIAFFNIVISICTFFFFAFIFWLTILAIILQDRKIKKNLNDPNEYVYINGKLKVNDPDKAINIVKKFFKEKQNYLLTDLKIEDKKKDMNKTLYNGNLKNGIKIKVMSMNNGFLITYTVIIGYTRKTWMEALELQIDLDEYIAEKGFW